MFNRINSDPYEVFAGKDVNIKKSIKSGLIKKIKRGKYALLEENGDVTYEYLDPFLPENAEKLKPKCEKKHIIDTSNVYDPRSNSYGTSYRSYIDKMTGQVRYYYDDINAIRQPNYITRNNILH